MNAQAALDAAAIAELERRILLPLSNPQTLAVWRVQSSMRVGFITATVRGVLVRDKGEAEAANIADAVAEALKRMDDERRKEG